MSSSFPGLPLVCWLAPAPTTFDERNGLFEVLDTPLTSSACAVLLPPAAPPGALAETEVAAAAPVVPAGREGDPCALYG